MKILAIDDNYTIAHGYKYRYGAVPFTQYEAFMEELHKERPDLLILDLNIGVPKINGWTIADEARELYPGLPIIIATAYDDPLQKAMAEFKGVEFWSKGCADELDVLRGLITKYGNITRTNNKEHSSSCTDRGSVGIS